MQLWAKGLSLSLSLINLPGVPALSPVVLAPLAGITDLPFRRLVSGFGVGWVVSEMVASQEIVQAKPSARDRAELGYDQSNTAVQLAGRDPYWIAEAAKLVEGNGAKIIDINMGCPAKKVTNGYSGSALMKEPDHALRLIEAVVEAVSVPVTLKTRLGWDHDTLNAPDIARRAEAAGVQLVTIHGRTRQQFYKDHADWRAIRAVRDAVSIPVVANGDILSAQDAQTALEQSGADAVMVGRGAQGRPWQPAAILAALTGAAEPDVPVGDALVEMVVVHYEDMLAFYGEPLGVRNARKHLGWYMDEAGTPAATRHQVLTEPDPLRVVALLSDALQPSDVVAA